MKKNYVKPKINRIKLDKSISLVMMTWNPGDGKPPWAPGKPPWAPGKPPSPPGSPFNSPFDDSPFN